MLLSVEMGSQLLCALSPRAPVPNMCSTSTILKLSTRWGRRAALAKSVSHLASAPLEVIDDVATSLDIDDTCRTLTFESGGSDARITVYSSGCPSHVRS